MSLMFRIIRIVTSRWLAAEHSVPLVQFLKTTISMNSEAEEEEERPCPAYKGKPVAGPEGKALCEECGWERFYHGTTSSQLKMLLKDKKS